MASLKTLPADDAEYENDFADMIELLAFNFALVFASLCVARGPTHTNMQSNCDKGRVGHQKV